MPDCIAQHKAPGETPSASTPKLFKARRIGGRVLHRMLNLPVAQIILNEPRIRALVGKGEAARVAQHVRMGREGQGRGGARGLQKVVDAGTVQRLPLLAHKERFDGRGQFHTGADFQPCVDRPDFVGA